MRECLRCVANGGNEVITGMFLSLTDSGKRVLVLLMAVILGGCLLAVCLGQATGERGQFPKSAPDAAEAEEEMGRQDESAFGDDPSFSDRLSYNPEGGIYYRMMLAILIVVVLGAAAIYVSRKLLPRITNLPGKEIRVAETVHLGPKKAVHLLEVGSRRFLIGSTSESVTKLADITSDSSDISTQRADYSWEHK
ncbi:MAG: FliO/MopB family protein [Planctomycetota bacterium]